MTLRNLKALIKSEAAGYLYAPVAYVFLFISLLLAGAFTFQLSGFFANGQATLRDFFFWHPWLYLILLPAIGMRLWSDERRAGTMELLFTMPNGVGDWSKWRLLTRNRIPMPKMRHVKKVFMGSPFRGG